MIRSGSSPTSPSCSSRRTGPCSRTGVVFHGRRVCHSRKPACGACAVANWCPSYGTGETDPEKAAKLLKYELAPGQEELLAKLLAETHRAAEIRMESQRRPQ